MPVKLTICKNFTLLADTELAGAATVSYQNHIRLGMHNYHYQPDPSILAPEGQVWKLNYKLLYGSFLAFKTGSAVLDNSLTI